MTGQEMIAQEMVNMLKNAIQLMSDGKYNESAKMMKILAENDVTMAQNLLGDFYFMGWGVPKDYNEAAKWHRKAAAKGNSDSKEVIEKLEAMGLISSSSGGSGSSSPAGTLTSNPYTQDVLNSLSRSQTFAPARPAPSSSSNPPPRPAPASSNVWEFNTKSYVHIQEVYKSEGARVKKGDKLLKYDGKVLKSEVDGIIDAIPPFSCRTDLTVRIIIGK